MSELTEPAPFYLTTITTDIKEYEKAGYRVVIKGQPKEHNDITVVDMVMHKHLDIPLKSEWPRFDAKTIITLKRIKQFANGHFTRAIQGYRNVDQFTRIRNPGYLTADLIQAAAWRSLELITGDPYGGIGSLKNDPW